MPVKKSELYSSLWASCDELRGGMDASQYKDYVLVLLFVKYVSDRYAGDPYAPIQIPKGASFKDMVALKGKSDIGDQINKKIIAPLATANNLSDMPDFNDATKLGAGKEMVDRLTNLIAIFENPALDFSKNRADGDDILGDAYEYLMRHFATESGKSKGQFYTPAEVSRVIAKVIGIRKAKTSPSTTIYDPTCGSGSLLLKVADEATTGVSLYGQEKDATTAGLARMNMILHDNPTAVIKQGNTIANPLFLENGQLKTFDFVVANPPFSDKRWSTGLDPESDPHERFKHFGVPPAKQGDYAYLLHIVRSLKSRGRGACILPHGVLFRGNAEAEIRKNLVRKGYIQGIIGLPPNLFYGTGIPACIVVIDKGGAAARRGIFMVDASKGFQKDGNKNRLREMDIRRIVDVFTGQIEQPGYSRMVSFEEIEKNDFNLNLPRYIDSQEEEDVQDIEGHLRGGIPVADVDALGEYWEVCPKLRSALFRKLRKGYVKPAVEKSELRAAIHEHPEFVAFIDEMESVFEKWRKRTAKKLKALKPGFRPKELVAELGDSLLRHYEERPLLSKYDVYQHLMDYWAEAMQDDAYHIAAEGWKAEPHRIIVRDKKGKEKDKGWACDLVPKELVVARYFNEDQAALAELLAEFEVVSSQLAELEEEHGGDDGILAAVASKTDAQQARHEAVLQLWAAGDPANYAAYNEALARLRDGTETLRALEATPYVQACTSAKGRITLGNVKKRMKEVREPEELQALSTYKETLSEVKEAKKQAKELLSSAEQEVAKQLAAEPENEELADLRVLERYLDLLERLGELKKGGKNPGPIKKAEADLDAKALAKYDELTEDEIKSLVVDDKWLASLGKAIHGGVERISQALTRRVKELAERYETPLPELSARVAELETKVDEHLKRMGFSW